MNIIGLDIATKLGFVVLDQYAFPGTLAHGVINPKKQDCRMETLLRYRELVTEILLGHNVEFAVLEGYGFASKRIVPTAEIGTIVRMALHTNAVPYIEVAPNSLKKFVLQSGVGEKSQMIKEVYKRWQFDAYTDDEADAFGLAAIGVCLQSPSDPAWTTKPQRDVVSALREKGA